MNLKYRLSNLKYISRLVFESPKDRATDSSAKHVFLHIPKTGINSLIHMIYDNHVQSQIYPNYFEKVIKQKGKYFSNSDILGNWDTLLKNKSWFIGHTTYNMAERIWPGSLKYTMFRQPRARIISHLLHLLRKSESQDVNELDRICEQHLNSLVYMQANFFGYKSGKNNLDKVKENINTLQFTGIMEHFEESLILLQRLLNWRTARFEEFNRADNYLDEYIELIDSKLSEVDIIDNEVYDFALKKFYNQCKEYKIEIRK